MSPSIKHPLRSFQFNEVWIVCISVESTFSSSIHIDPLKAEQLFTGEVAASA